MKRKPGRPRGPGRAKRTYVSVRRETFRLIEAAAVARGTTIAGLVEMACRDVKCPDCTAEKAGV